MWTTAYKTWVCRQIFVSHDNKYKIFVSHDNKYKIFVSHDNAWAPVGYYQNWSNSCQNEMSSCSPTSGPRPRRDTVSWVERCSRKSRHARMNRDKLVQTCFLGWSAGPARPRAQCVQPTKTRFGHSHAEPKSNMAYKRFAFDAAVSRRIF